uniref:Uncharacterized protein n=1 Tax=Octactis speculum TaxID=3111310 RepID=A0A7S2CNW5_9STRA
MGFMRKKESFAACRVHPTWRNAAIHIHDANTQRSTFSGRRLWKKIAIATTFATSLSSINSHQEFASKTVTSSSSVSSDCPRGDYNGRPNQIDQQDRGSIDSPISRSVQFHDKLETKFENEPDRFRNLSCSDDPMQTLLSDNKEQVLKQVDGAKQLVHAHKVLQTKVAKLERLVAHKTRLVSEGASNEDEASVKEKINDLTSKGRLIKRLQATKEKHLKQMEAYKYQHGVVSLDQLTRLQLDVKKKLTDLENDQYDLDTMKLRAERMRQTQLWQAQLQADISAQHDTYKELYRTSFNHAHKHLSRSFSSIGYRESPDSSSLIPLFSNRGSTNVQAGQEAARRAFTEIVESLSRSLDAKQEEQNDKAGQRSTSMISDTLSMGFCADDSPALSELYVSRGDDSRHHQELEFLASEYSSLCTSVVTHLSKKYIKKNGYKQGSSDAQHPLEEPEYLEKLKTNNRMASSNLENAKRFRNRLETEFQDHLTSLHAKIDANLDHSIAQCEERWHDNAKSYEKSHMVNEVLRKVTSERVVPETRATLMESPSSLGSKAMKRGINFHPDRPRRQSAIELPTASTTVR